MTKQLMKKRRQRKIPKPHVKSNTLQHDRGQPQMRRQSQYSKQIRLPRWLQLSLNNRTSGRLALVELKTTSSGRLQNTLNNRPQVEHRGDRMSERDNDAKKGIDPKKTDECAVSPADKARYVTVMCARSTNTRQHEKKKGRRAPRDPRIASRLEDFSQLRPPRQRLRANLGSLG